MRCSRWLGDCFGELLQCHFCFHADVIRIMTKPVFGIVVGKDSPNSDLMSFAITRQQGKREVGPNLDAEVLVG